MYKACSKCGKIHDSRQQCKSFRVYQTTNERALRSTSRWKEKSLEIRERANWLCEVCRDQGVYTYDGLEVHHIEKIKDRKDGLLDDSNLICLCVEHHKLADAGKIDKEYLRKLAEVRDQKVSPVGS